MLIKFAVTNWMSFRDRTEFSMIATSERQHGERLYKVKKPRARLLPVAAVFGGNASGKTNFFEAMKFAKEFICNGRPIDAAIPVVPFQLNKEYLATPTTFEFEILVDKNVYQYQFAATREKVTYEKLEKGETVLFERKENEFQTPLDNSTYHFHKMENDHFENFIKVFSETTRDNILFLTNAVSQKINEYKPVYDWFAKTLHLVSPEEGIFGSETIFTEGNKMGDILAQLDTGVSSLIYKNIPLDSIILPGRLKERLQDNPKRNIIVFIQMGRDFFKLTSKDGVFSLQKMVTGHTMAEGDTINFDMDQESDGTRRIIELLPLFFDLSDIKEAPVYIIDEIDRSLHTHMTRALLEAYLASCAPNRQSQLIFTTHDTQLIDQELFRRDEIWVAERDRTGNSSLTSFSEYKDVRYDKDIRKSYLQGRLGGVPHLSFRIFTDPKMGDIS